jgi:hypothetical protein
MTATTAPTTSSAAPSAVPSAGRRFRRRHLWIVPGLAIAILANGQAQLNGLGIAPLIVFGIAPHLPALLPGARRLFNVTHHPLPPAAVAVLAWTGLLPPIAAVGSLAWLSHIVVDWALGDGHRRPDGSRHGWPG